LTDALVYLKDYPYECSEQGSSRILALVAMQDVLHAFKTLDVSQSSLKQLVAKGLKRLKDKQCNDGGMGLFSAYYSMYVMLCII
jgi:uncharacterized protein YfaS (alpha-2-macroglobulin family)